jgi:hypothetical protein
MIIYLVITVITITEYYLALLQLRAMVKTNFIINLKVIIIIHHYNYQYFEHQNYWVHDYY